MAALSIVQSSPIRTYSMRESRIRKIIFTFTSAAAESGTTNFNLTGKLLRYVSTGGDAAHDFTLNDGVADIFTKTGLNTSTSSGALTQSDGSSTFHGIPIAGPLTLTMANNSTAGGAITIYWEEI